MQLRIPHDIINQETSMSVLNGSVIYDAY